MIRATTGGVLKSYRSNLMNSFIRMNGATNTVLTQRNFNSYAEDPASASKAFQLRRSYMRTENQKSVNSAIIGKYDSGAGALKSVVDMVDNRADNSTLETVLRGNNDPTGDARTALGKVLSQLSESIVETMNSKYGSTFIFAGADGLNVPFEMTDGVLTYRGVPVDAAVPDVVTDAAGEPVKVNEDGEYDPNGQFYLLSDQTYAMSKDEYEAFTTILQDPNGDVRVDSTGKIDPAGDHRILAKRAEAVDIADVDDPDTAFILRDANGDPVEVDVDGNIAAGGGYYLSLDSGMIGDDYTLPTALDDGAGTLQTVDKDGNFDLAGDYYLVTNGANAVVSIEDYDKSVEDVAKLDYMSSESYYVDIGLGFQWNDNADKLISSSGFDAALQGINFLGYGLDEDGDPKNVVSLINRMADILNNYSDESWNAGGRAEYERLMNKFADASDTLRTEHANMWAAATGLNDNYDRLDDDMYTLKEQYGAIEDVDMAEALSDFLWAQYCYNAALKMGSTILGPSLMDYLQ